MDPEFERRITSTWVIFRNDDHAPWKTELPEQSQFRIERRANRFWFVPLAETHGPMAEERELTPDPSESKRGDYPHGTPLIGALYADFGGAQQRIYFTLTRLTGRRSVISLTRGSMGPADHGGSHGIDD